MVSDIHNSWAWVVIIGNALAGVWARLELRAEEGVREVLL